MNDNVKEAIERVKIWKQHIYEDNFQNNIKIIAQDDDCDYEESGYIVFYCEDLNVCLIYPYSHCSCFSTGSSIERGDFNPSWSGNRDELLNIAENRWDFSLPGREANSDDYDYDHLIEVYKQILKYFKNE